MDDFLLSVIGVLTITILLFGFAVIDTHKPAKKYRAAIKQCEAELPRNRHCVITAVPEEEDNG